MSSARSPAAFPVALFVLGVVLAGQVTHLPLGLPFTGAALALTLGRRRGVLVCAGFAGIVWGAAFPSPRLNGIDPERLVEISGRIESSWLAGPDSFRTTLLPFVVRQGRAIWLSAPRVTLEVPADAESARIPPGSVVRLRGELRRAAGFENERRSRPGRFRLRLKSSRFLEVLAPPSRFAVSLFAARSRIEAPFVAEAPHHHGVRYARALLFGDGQALPDEERRAFRRSGLTHLVAASGMNVSLVVVAAAIFASFFPRRPRNVMFLSAIAAHFLLVGPVPSLARATVMALCGLAAIALSRPPVALQSLALALAALVAVTPELIFDAGFQLSCAATAGLIAGVSWLTQRWSRGPLALRSALATSVAAQLATIPISSALFASVSPASFVLNLVAVPLAGLLLIGAFFWCGAAIATPQFGGALAWPLDLAAAPFKLLAWLPAGPWLSIPTTGSWTSGWPFCLLLAGLALTRAPWRRVCGLLGLLLLLDGTRASSTEFELTMADVSQGEGLLLRRGERAILIDGGGVPGRDLAADVWLPMLASRGLTRLDGALVTHAHGDHCGGLVDIAVHVPISRVFGSPGVRDSACVAQLLAWSGARWTSLVAGDTVPLDWIELAVLAPDSATFGSKANDQSLVLRLDGGGRRILLTGDLDGRAEARLALRARETLRADVLKVGHHGSGNSTGETLLAAVQPRLALVSAGVRNRFGHPSPAVVGRLARRGARLYRTDLQGEIRLQWQPAGPLRVELPATPRRQSG